jgi:hypothetical protein
VASHSEVAEQARILEDQKALIDQLNKEMKALKKDVKKLVPLDKDDHAAGSGGGLVLASSNREVNAETVSTAAAQAVRPVQQQVVRMEHRVDELAALIASHGDPVLKSHLEDLNNEAVPVMKKRDGVLGWQVRYMAVRRRTLFYGNSYEAVMEVIADCPPLPSTDRHVISLEGCHFRKCQKESDPSHFAFVLTTAEVNAGCLLCCMRRLLLLRAVVMNAAKRLADKASQGEQLLWSTSDLTLRVAIEEAVKCCSAPSAAATAAAAPSDERRLLLLGHLDAAGGGQSGVEDLS